MTADAIKQAAETLRIAEDTSTGCNPIREAFSTLETPQRIQTAYAIKRHNHRHWQSTRQASGLKIGLTSALVRQFLGLEKPDYGLLYRDMELDNDGTLSLAKFVAPKLEVEWALILGQNISKPLTSIEALKDKISHICLAFEIVDSRIANWDVQAMELIADNGAGGAYLLSESSVAVNGIDLSQHTVELTHNGETMHSLCASDELGDPWQHALWLVNTAIEEGVSLPQGQVLLTGTLTPIAELNADEHWQASTVGFHPITLKITQ
ncbi:MAG: hypothetical protein CL693_13290 [Cellvibrionaceae bacterium]|nr:hypothetical protein [Cellvibrionaceae bacterium]|tara:strand:+ start:15897 stop:16691 length:795 start_codon:yes stop_codon:yes gene_type:complete